MEKTHASIFNKNEDRPSDHLAVFGTRGDHHNLSCMLCYLWFL